MKSTQAWKALMVGVVLTTTACGTRVDVGASRTLEGSEPTAIAPASNAQVDTSQVSPAGVTEPSGAPALVAGSGGPSGASRSPQTAAVPTGKVAASPAGDSSPAAQRSQQGSPTGTPVSGGNGSGSSAGKPGGNSTDGRAPATPGTPSTPVTRSPVIIGNVSSLSGPLGAVAQPAIQTLQVWARYVNGKGGLNGHPVDLLVYDDGADPARHRAQIQEAVEQRHAIAFLHNFAPFTGQASVEYLNAKRVPLVGNEGGGDWHYESPMFFPQASTGQVFWHAIVDALPTYAVAKGKTKLATVVCVEATPCNQMDKVIAEEAPSRGFEHVYRGRVSIAQPDFTAECLSARNAGANIFFLGTEANSVSRIVAACARQGYRPLYATMGSAQGDAMKNNANIDEMVVAVNVFPYFQSGTPATDEYQQVMRTIGSKVAPGISASTAWVSAKLFEKVTTNLPEPPTSDAILRGLWSLRGDDLGGLTGPLTFTEGQNASKTICGGVIAMKNKEWFLPDGRFTLHCR